MAKPAQIGDQLPNLGMDGTAGPFRLEDYRGKKVIFYFYPRDATPGCTLEGHEFSKLLPNFQKKNAVVFGISRDTLASHEKFKKKECYAVDLLSDEDEKVCELFDVIKEKNMYGKKVMGVERSTFVIDEKGKLIHAWRKVKPEGHAQDVLDFLS